MLILRCSPRRWVTRPELVSCGCFMRGSRVGLAQSTTSEHLRILKAAGIITGEIEGPRVCYSLNPTALVPLRSFLQAVIESALPSAQTKKS